MKCMYCLLVRYSKHIGNFWNFVRYINKFLYPDPLLFVFYWERCDFFNWMSFVVTLSKWTEMDFKCFTHVFKNTLKFAICIHNDYFCHSKWWGHFLHEIICNNLCIYIPNDWWNNKLGQIAHQVHQLYSFFLGVNQVYGRPYINMNNEKWYGNWPWKIQFAIPKTPYIMCYTVSSSFNPFFDILS